MNEVPIVGTGQELRPGDRILVTVELALADVLVVSYLQGFRNFQGALLDAAKRGLPCGIEPPETMRGPEGDKLSSIASRFSYFQEKRRGAERGRNDDPPSRNKQSRPTVRLRPRQILCNNCQSICNEKNENVGRKRKTANEDAGGVATRRPRRKDRKSTRKQKQQEQEALGINHNNNNIKQVDEVPNLDDQTDESSCSKTISSNSCHSEPIKFTAALIPEISASEPMDVMDCAVDSSELTDHQKPPIDLDEETRSTFLILDTDAEDDVEMPTSEEPSQSQCLPTPSNRDAISRSPCLQKAASELEVNQRRYRQTPVSEEEVSRNHTLQNEDGRSVQTPMSNVGFGRCLRSDEEVSRSPSPIDDPPEIDSDPNITCATPRCLSRSSVESAKIPLVEEFTNKMEADSSTEPQPEDQEQNSIRASRKKRSVGLMEDLWDETIFEDPTRITRTTPVIKISFGSEGEGTVLKIPSKVHHTYLSDCEDTMPLDDYNFTIDAKAEAEVDSATPAEAQLEDYSHMRIPPNDNYAAKDCEASAKAAKKALKKAKKKALKFIYGAMSPGKSSNSTSPRYHATFDKMFLLRRRKHKVKHKKRHRQTRSKRKDSVFEVVVKPEEQANAETTESTVVPVEAVKADPRETEVETNIATPPRSPATDGEFIKEQCLKQKLSISLKRLSANVFEASNSSKSGDEGYSTIPVLRSSCSQNSTHPLVVRLSAAPLATYKNNPGKRMAVGDVVWGKIQGFPWWPGKVLSIIDTSQDRTAPDFQAHIAWYGSSTSSIMRCNQLSPFLETFKTRYNKKKRGPYKEAIRQAQTDAKFPVAPTSPTRSPRNVLGVCGSPRQVNVMS